MKKAQYSAIHKFVGWWFVMKEGTACYTGQILRTGDVSSSVLLDNGSATGIETDLANSALLDTRIVQLFPLEWSARNARRQLEQAK